MDLVFLLGLLSSVGVVAISLVSKPRSIQWVSLALATVTGVQYLVLQENIAAALSGVSFLYAATMLLFSNRFKFLHTKTATVSLLAIYAIIFFSLNGIAFNAQLFSYFGASGMIAIMLMKNQIAVKYVMLASGVCWLFFSIEVGAYGQIIGQVFYFIGATWSLVQLYRAKSVKVEEAPVSDAPESTVTKSLTAV